MKNFRITTPKDKEAVKAYLDRLPDGKHYDVVVKLHREKRTLSQNNLFHLWCSCIADETGEDKARIKILLKEMFLGYKEYGLFGHKTFSLPSTSALDTKQMSEFMNKVQVWASAEMGILLPVPEDEFFYQFEEQYKNRI